MEIIKLGIKEELTKRTFTCPNCGCKFKATDNEFTYHYDFRENCSWLECDCPMEFCHTVVRKYI